MERKTFFTELAYVLGLITLAFGTALMERADFGMSMIVAPAYLLHLKVSQYMPFFSFGMAEYTLQAVIIIALAVILRRFQLTYLFSFVTAVVYGVVLDGCILLAACLPADTAVFQTVYYLGGMLICAVGVSLLFHTYISPEAYELFVKELSVKLRADIHKCKTVYDCTSCAVGIALSFLFFGFGHFEGVKLGTVFCAAVNGWLIGRCTRVLERIYVFRDGLPFRKYFE